MSIELNVGLSEEKLKSFKIFVATPMYGGKCYGNFMKSCLSLQELFIQNKVRFEFSFISGDSLVTRARNTLVDMFMSTDCTHLLFIDSDLEFNPHDVFTFLFFDKDVIAAPYSKKYINWDKIITAVKNNPDISPDELKKLSGTLVFNLLPETEKIKVDEPSEVLEIGTGFMMIKRNVFQKLSLEYPNLKYKEDLEFNIVRKSKFIYSFFDTMIDNEDSIIGENSNRYLSEDYTFCRLWRKIGGKVYMCPWIVTVHHGSYGFVSSLDNIARLTGSL